jgi:hypothetical protein
MPLGVALLISAGDAFVGGDVRYGLSLDEDVETNGLLMSLGAGVAF